LQWECANFNQKTGLTAPLAVMAPTIAGQDESEKAEMHGFSAACVILLTRLFKKVIHTFSPSSRQLKTL
jgi:hypothetical protein